MADDEDIKDEAEEPQGNEDADENAMETDSKKAPPPLGLKSPTPGRQYGVPEAPRSVQRRMANYSGGKPSKHDKDKLMRSEGIIPIQAGSNKYASQRGMTGIL
ncbi:unnamed protein product [Gongylonema pulchrum]|uniref:PEST proteolytic signal-containing nuclear protein n=1 Tax=Gongylonema pulchrum TaxID=637853 RepID=A0A183DQF2_9BILA|nr:unnamed protein product [Gongylonema pulchrum]